MEKCKSNGNDQWSGLVPGRSMTSRASWWGRQTCIPRSWLVNFFSVIFSIGIIRGKSGIGNLLEDPFSRLNGFLTSGAPSAASTWSSHMRSLPPLGTLTDIRWPFPKEGIKTGVQVTDSTVMRSKQIFFTLSPDGLTQFSLDHTVFIDLKRWLLKENVKETIFYEGGYEMQGSISRWLTSARLQGFNSWLKGQIWLFPGFVSGSPSGAGGRL